MRLWSIHPKYLDSKGLVALWRETLLAKNVLEGKTKGYTNHPQLNRFKSYKNPLEAINYYLETIYTESVNRGYNFNKDKFNKVNLKEKIEVTDGQLHYEFNHLLNKLKIRDPDKYNQYIKIKKIDSNNCFTVVTGDIEEWEVINV